MDLATTFCPNPDCPARGQSGKGNIGIHSHKERRCVSKQCHKTFTVTTDMAFYRVRTSAERGFRHRSTENVLSCFFTDRLPL
jgi:hypothetical protein